MEQGNSISLRLHILHNYKTRSEYNRLKKWPTCRADIRECKKKEICISEERERKKVHDKFVNIYKTKQRVKEIEQKRKRETALTASRLL